MHPWKKILNMLARKLTSYIQLKAEKSIEKKENMIIPAHKMGLYLSFFFYLLKLYEDSLWGLTLVIHQLFWHKIVFRD